MNALELRKRREALKLTQEALARVLGVSWSTIARWEAGAPISQPGGVALALDHLDLERRRGVKEARP